jgi:hypothetical protein
LLFMAETMRLRKQISQLKKSFPVTIFLQYLNNYIQ